MANAVALTLTRLKAAGFTVIEGQKGAEMDVEFEEFLKIKNFQLKTKAVLMGI